MKVAPITEHTWMIGCRSAAVTKMRREDINQGV
jgi:hypothetical protein